MKNELEVSFKKKLIRLINPCTQSAVSCFWFFEAERLCQRIKHRADFSSVSDRLPWSVHRKCHSISILKLERKRQFLCISIYSNFKMKIEWHFRCRDYPHSFFIFIKNRKTKYSSFFIFQNELLKNIKINFIVFFTSIICMLFKSKFVSSPRRFSAVQRSRGHQESAVQKTADVFYCLYYWLLLSYLLYSYSQLRYKTLTKAATVRCSLKVVPKIIH